MTKGEFMKELSKLLDRIPENERRDALEYYEDYFVDAGIIGDTMLVPESMGSPKEIADTIISETGYGSHREQDNTWNQTIEANKNFYYEKKEKDTISFTKENNHNSDKDMTKIVVTIVLIVVFSPFWISLISVIGSLALALVCTLGGVGIGMLIAGVCLLVTAFLASSFAGGILLAGLGFLGIAVAAICIVLLVIFCGWFLPWAVKGIVKVCKWLFGRREAVS